MVAPSSAYRHMQQDEDPCGSGCGADSAARDDGNDVRGGSDDDAAGGGIGTIRRGKRKRDPPIPFEALLNPDFEELARRYPAFRAAYHHRNTPPSSSIKGGGDDHDGDDANSRTAGRGSVNRPMQAAMATPQFRLELCRALLHRHWGLQLPTFDPDRNLCPPVPNRYYFVHWLKYTVLPGTRRWFQEDDHHLLESPPLVEPIRVLDIGTGSAAIYALLWAAAAASDVTQGDDSGNNEETEIYATDVDDESVLVAASNVAANQPHLWTEKKAKVHALKVEPTDHQKQRQHPRHFPSAHFRKGPMEGVMYSADGNTDEDEIPGGPLRRSLETVAALPCTQDNSVAPHPSRNLAAAPPPPTNRRFDLCLTNPPFFDLDEEPCPRADGQDRTAMTHHEGTASCAFSLSSPSYISHSSFRNATSQLLCVLLPGQGAIRAVSLAF
jgi:23S rRNA A1618 N6-methylase RlmF